MKAQIKFTNKKDAGRLAFIEGHSVPTSFPEITDGPLSFSGRNKMIRNATIELKKIIRFVMCATATQDDFTETYENRKEIFKER